ncbi:hypothetical protein FNO01nite_26070 [Flavobacterium noncentrifugens]|uniref:SIMPL domain-containing protein n=1 Tax=Flavobacterium noncentrifugens TaxID=1128970 RepID=A0A1G8ZGZ8_9FLAO|nr:SIMPL domain-containing protein [Flavobacterium noncentrifugens]GEP51935.1 hypothetical protein FNO01nite_26070 [Flavobacterium noncentrifugens]SDK14392.1 hypothetical protein SAMN04487935_2592 [Flavobacterium noncentrifugens]
MIKQTLFFTIALYTFNLQAQSKNFIDQPYIETLARADTLVSPDRIFLNIIVKEKDSKGKISVEELEKNMYEKLKSIGIDTKKDLLLNNLSSNYRKYFLKSQDIQKSKSYTLMVTSAQSAGEVIAALEDIEISNVSLESTAYSKSDQMALFLKSKAVAKARIQALALAKPLNQKVSNAILISDLTDAKYSSRNMMARKQLASKELLSRESKGEDSEADEVEFVKIKLASVVNVTFRLE